MFPGEYQNKFEVLEFLNLYNLDVEAFLDQNYLMANMLGATVTPEVVLVDRLETIIYKGAIDDWAYGPGLKKQQVTKTYLNDAIDEVILGNMPKVKYVKAFGCYIES